MFKIAHHPKAFLTLKRNVQPGLSARTQIIFVLEKRACDAKTFQKKQGLATQLSFITFIFWKQKTF